MARLERQMPLEKKKEFADYVIDIPAATKKTPCVRLKIVYGDFEEIGIMRPRALILTLLLVAGFWGRYRARELDPEAVDSTDLVEWGSSGLTRSRRTVPASRRRAEQYRYL